jgi:hypothetical protein
MIVQFNPFDALELLVAAAVIFAVMLVMGTRVKR